MDTIKMFGLSSLYYMLAAAALSALVVIPATYYITSLPYKTTIAKMEADAAKLDADRANKVLAKFQETANGIAISAKGFQNDNGILQAKFATISAALAVIRKNRPLPATCKPDADRLRNLNEAISSANAAVGSIPSK